MKKALIGAASVLTVGLGGCGWLSEAGVNEALSVCAPHGGLKAVHPRKWGTTPEYEAECKDGKSIIGRAKDAA